MDKNYWSNYYLNQRQDRQPSLFAIDVVENYVSNGRTSLIELGCGNGRDSIYFSEKGLNVVAVDQVEEEIVFLRNQFSNLKNIEFTSGDFTDLKDARKFDIIYSRFTLHSINKSEEQRVLNWAFEHLNDDGLFCIEVRGKKNELYKKGEKVEREEDAYIYNDHYRRFLDFETFCEDLKNLGFKIDFSQESEGFAPYKTTNETFIRVIARK